ncbi:LysR family transcriptional regulator [Noviherbaspirillum saxi]|uniref:LysR family transcriptional regulator n=1 Tax=Noviherbaspirillum saxi TaxID=2320863 RepID=A0A3A3G3D3_9BURK|nr:LysR family transcriptional regulator [Noviherbaspirillum saxi]RJF95916.1 LysR family transcriptional regulator [Noviherbaspirillum saxi]
MPKFDLNLLPIAVAIAKEKSVSRAAEALGMSQPAVSAALNRLRQVFNDELFIRTAHGMEPTPRALTLIEPAREILTRVEEEVLQKESFEPSKASDTFTLALSDIGEMVFLPKLLERIQRDAPLASVSSVTLPAHEVAHALESGRVDLAVGYFPDIQSNNFFQQRLFSHSFTCLLRADHKIRGNRLTMPQFLELGHAVIKAEGRSQEVFERFLEAKNLRRRIVLSTPHFMTIPFIVATTDLVVTVPLAVGTSFASFANIKLMKPPIAIPSFDLRQHWHRKYHQDPRNIWLRNLVAELFSNDPRW